MVHLPWVGLSGRVPGLALSFPGARPAVPPPGVSTTGFPLFLVCPGVRSLLSGDCPCPLPGQFNSSGPPDLKRRCMFLPVVRIPWVPLCDREHSKRGCPGRAYRPRVSRPQVFPPELVLGTVPPFWTCGGASPHPGEGVGFFPLRGGARRAWARIHLVPRTAGPPSWISRC